jgi:hypothetical protein
MPIVAAAGLVACHTEQPDFTMPQSMISEAQAKSTLGKNPRWLHYTDKPALFRGVRNRAYGYCFAHGRIDLQCASEQDDAVEGAVLALDIASDQARMRDKSSLGIKEHFVATNPEVAPRVAKFCWALYKDHGAADARILSVCLGNLTDYSPLLPLPVP